MSVCINFITRELLIQVRRAESDYGKGGCGLLLIFRDALGVGVALGMPDLAILEVVSEGIGLTHAYCRDSSDREYAGVCAAC